MNFLQAKNIVSPDKPVVPGSPEHKEILLIMRQSGRVFPEDNVPAPPIVARSIKEFYRAERKPVSIEPMRISKRDWLMISSNREAMKQEVIPQDVYEFPSTLPTPGMSKKEWLRNKITPTIINDGPDVRGEKV
jgi:hypothetical protein